MPKNQEDEQNQGNGQNPEDGIQKASQTAVMERDPLDVSTYRILNRSEDAIAQAMDIFQHNLRGQKITERDLRRVKVPPQGITIWSIPTTEGDIHTEEITGILVEYTTPRAYWDRPMDPNTLTPPNCSSPQRVDGHRRPRRSLSPMRLQQVRLRPPRGQQRAGLQGEADALPATPR